MMFQVLKVIGIQMVWSDVKYTCCGNFHHASNKGFLPNSPLQYSDLVRSRLLALL